MTVPVEKPKADTVTLTASQAQELLDYLATCPAGHVYTLIGYILAAQEK